MDASAVAFSLDSYTFNDFYLIQEIAESNQARHLCSRAEREPEEIIGPAVDVISGLQATRLPLQRRS